MHRPFGRHALAFFALVACVLSGLNAQRGTWVQRRITTTSPPALRGHAMAYDSTRGRTVMFGGSSQADTWEWDGKSWTQINTVTTPPSARSEHAMVYDSARQRTVLFGGWSKANLADTWEWDGKNWMQIKPLNSPPGRQKHAMVFDSGRGRTVLFGGASRLTPVHADTWEWDGKNWTQIRPATSPPGRDVHAMAYDLSRGRTVLFGGWNGSKRMADTWEWDGKNWTQINPATSPAARGGHAMAYDWVRGRTVIFGGFPGRNDTWEWDGKNWTKITPVTSPSARQQHAMAYDFARRRTVMFGGWASGPSAELWEYIGSSPATFTTFGTGCKGSAGIPQLTATTQPIYGKTFTTTLSQLQTAPAASPFMIVGMSNQQWGAIKLPLDLGLIGLPGCKLLVSTDVSLLLKNSAGTARFNLVIPSKNSWLIGKSFYLQGAVLDLKANPLGVALSNAGKATIGY